jgi:hypothetical protein
MRRRTKVVLTAAVVGLIATGCVKDLGTLSGAAGTSSTARDINDSNVIVGESESKPFVLRPTETMQALPLPPFHFGGTAVAINASETIVGSAMGLSETPTAVIWKNGSVTTISPSSSAKMHEPKDINTVGVIVGTQGEKRPTPRGDQWFYRAVVRSATGSLARLPESADQSVADGVNDLGHIVGSVLDVSGTSRPVLWIPQTGSDTYSLVFLSAPGVVGEAKGINSNGDVVGFVVVDGRKHGAWWKASSHEFVDLGAIGDLDTRAVDITDAGTIVGSTRDAAGMSQAYRWTVDGKWQTLGNLGGTHAEVQGANNNKAAVGNALVGDGNVRHAVKYDI